MDEPAQGVAPKVPLVAVFVSAFDPISSADLRMAAELCNMRAVDAVLLVPFGCEYESIDKADGGLTALSRYVLAHVGVESTLPSSCPVSVANVAFHSKTTDQIYVTLRQWSVSNRLDLAWVRVTQSEDGLCDIALSSVPVLSSPKSLSVPLEALRSIASHRGFTPAVSSIPQASFVDRMRSSSQVSVYGLVPPMVMSAIKRYGLYRDSTTALLHSKGWYAQGWACFAGISPDPVDGVCAGHCTLEGASVDQGEDGIARSRTDVRFLRRRDASDAQHRVALFGGSFSPIAVHHLEVAAELVNTNQADEVWVVPCGPRPDKPTLKVSVYHRYVQCVLAVEAFVSASVPIYVIPVEVPHPVALSSYVLATALPRMFPGCSFEMVIGTDLVPTLHRWKHANRLLKEVRFLVNLRPGSQWDAMVGDTAPGCLPPPDHIRPMRIPTPLKLSSTSLSSTELRSRINEALNSDRVGQHDWGLAGLLPLPVLSFVCRYGVYGVPPTGIVFDVGQLKT